MCVVHVKYCNYLLAVDMAGVAYRGLCMCVIGSKDIGMGVRRVLWRGSTFSGTLACAFSPSRGPVKA